MGQLGADVDELERLGRGFEREGARLTATRDRLQAALATVTWFGPDAERFRGDWRSKMAPTLGRLGALLREQSAELVRQAREQRAASSPGPDAISCRPPGQGWPFPKRPSPWEQRRQPEPPQPPRTDAKGQTLQDILERYQVADAETVQWEPPWPESILTDPRKITEQEARMLDDIGTFGRKDFLDIHDLAFAEADERFPGQGREDGHNDAFRHAYWNALMTKRFGEAWARDYATAHEQLPGNPAPREAMDLYNNELGRRIATEHPDASPEELADLIQEAIENGEAVVIDENGELAFSDQVEPGGTGRADNAPPNPNGRQPDPDTDSDWSGGYNLGGADDESGTTTSGQ